MKELCYNKYRCPAGSAGAQKDIAELCKGSTADSDSVCEGSNPSSAAIEVWLSLVERYVRDVEAGGSNPLTSTKAEPET